MEPSRRLVWLAPLCKVLAITIALALAARLPGGREFLRVDHLKAWALSLGWRGACPLVVVGALAPLAFVPRWPLAVLFGLVYGTGWGLALATLSGLLGAVLQYRLTSAIVTARERASLESLPWYRALRGAPCPFMILISIRLFPLSNFTLTNLICGLLRVRFGVYVLSSAIGMFPSTALYVLAGHGASSANLKPTLWALALATLLVPLATMWGKKCVSGGADEAEMMAARPQRGADSPRRLRD